MQYVEVRGKLSIWGKLSRFVFWGWQALIVLWFVSYSMEASKLMDGVKGEAELAGANIGIGLAVMFILFFWTCGSVVFGLWMYFTRPARAMVPAAQTPDVP